MLPLFFYPDGSPGRMHDFPSGLNLKPNYGKEYQAIFTTAGHVLFGKIEKIDLYL